jgi:WD40 repeat protein
LQKSIAFYFNQVNTKNFCHIETMADDAVVAQMVKLVDERLKKEFEERDLKLTELMQKMNKLVTTMRDPSKLKNNGPTLKLHPRAPSSASRTSSSGSSLVSKKGGSLLKWGSRSDLPPKRKKKNNKAMFYGTKRRHPVRKGYRPYKSLPAVTKGKPSRDAYGRLEYHPMTPRVASIMEVGHNTKEAIAKRGSEYTKEDRTYDKLSVERLDYPECKSTVFRPSNFDEVKRKGGYDTSKPDSNLELDFIYGYAGFSPTVVGDLHGDQNIFYLSTGEMIYPASAVIVIYDPTDHTQRFFDKHDDDVSGMAIHPDGEIVATGQVGHAPELIIWRAVPYDGEESDPDQAYLFDSRGKFKGEQLGELMGHQRSIRAMDFSPDGNLLMSVGGDDHHTIFIWDWRDGEIIASAKGHASPVISCGFNPFNSRPIPKDNDAAMEDPDGILSDMHYTLISCGKKHIKFWTLSMVPDPEFAAAAAKTGKMGDDSAPKLPGKKAIDLVKKENVKKGKLTDEEVENRNGEKMKFMLEGDTGKFGKNKIQDILCFCFAQYEVTAEEDDSGEPITENRCAIITGAADGSLLFWDQTAIAPDSSDEDTDDEDDAYRATLDWWDSSGTLVKLQKKAHRGGIYGIQVIDETNQIITCGKKGDIKLWNLSSNEKGYPVMEEIHVMSAAESLMGGKIPRSMIYGGSFSPYKIILGTQGNEIIEYELNPEENTISITEDKVLMNAHQNILRGLATHPEQTRFVTASEDATVSVWDYESHVLIGQQVDLPIDKLTEKPSPSQTCCISSDGDLIACGLTSGWFCVYSGCNSENADLELVIHKSASPQKKSAGPPAGVKSGAKETKLQKAMAEKSQARSGKQVMFKVEEACCIRFSPDSTRLAVGSRDNNIYIFDCEKNYRRIGICRGHTSYITHIDWSQDGDFLQSNSGDYELLYWQSPKSEIFRTSHIIAGSPRSRNLQRRWDQYRDMSDMADCQWHSWTSSLGFPVMGIWPPYSDGTDVNMVDRSKNRKLIVTAEDTFKISLMRYPCLKGAEKKQVSAKNVGFLLCDFYEYQLMLLFLYV